VEQEYDNEDHVASHKYILLYACLSSHEYVRPFMAVIGKYMFPVSYGD